MLEGSTVIGEDCVLRAFTRLTNCIVGNGVEVLDHCVLTDSRIEDDAHLGPFVHLRPGVVVRKKAKVGNFVEMKKTDLGEGSKANHLSYLGDATIGKGVNIGAGTITCNYDGLQKFQTVIGDGVFLGSDTQLIAPVTIGAGAIIAAGTTVTEDVPADALVIGRVPQENRAGWAARRRALQVEVKRETLNVKGATTSARLTPDASRLTKKRLLASLASKHRQVKKRSRG
jgi:bifunctional UDP-N-acetylglucosamine pyrophosphorylase/glucosamine-1-phosphate N-acetyltransferase